jgi:hypothetical protein
MARSRISFPLYPLAARYLALASLCTIATGAPELSVATPYPFVGEVIAVAGNFCPRPFLPLNGQLLSTETYGDLFGLIGTKYGGNGSTNFALPMVAPTWTATGQPMLYCIAADNVFPVPLPN